MYCGKCGSYLNDTDQFCSKCGNVVESSERTVSMAWAGTGVGGNNEALQVKKQAEIEPIKVHTANFFKYITHALRHPIMSVEQISQSITNNNIYFYFLIILCLNTIIQILQIKLVIDNISNSFLGGYYAYGIIGMSGFENEVVKTFLLLFVTGIGFFAIAALLLWLTYRGVCHSQLNYTDTLKLLMNGAIVRLVMAVVTLVAALFSIKLTLLCMLVGIVLVATVLIIQCIRHIGDDARVVYLTPIVCVMAFVLNLYICYKFLG